MQLNEITQRPLRETLLRIRYKICHGLVSDQRLKGLQAILVSYILIGKDGTATRAKDQQWRNLPFDVLLLVIDQTTALKG